MALERAGAEFLFLRPSSQDPPRQGEDGETSGKSQAVGAARPKTDAIIYDSFDVRKESGFNSLWKSLSKKYFLVA
jgi:hypothetical protein